MARWKAFARFMSFYNRRLATLAQKRLANGTYGAANLGHDYVLRRSFSAGHERAPSPVEGFDCVVAGRVAHLDRRPCAVAEKHARSG